MRAAQLLKSATRVVAKVSGLLVGIAALVLTVAWLSGTFESKIEPSTDVPRAPVAQSWATDEVHSVTKEYIEEAVGTLKSSSRTVVAAKVLATIEAINVVAGDPVQLGDELIRLDAKEYEARLKQAQLALEAAVANREEAEKQFQRAQTLVESQAISRFEFDQTAKNIQVQAAEESRAQQAVAEAEVLLGYTTISASKAGRIVDRLSEPGDVAQPGKPLLVLYDPDALRLEAPVMERLAVKLKPGDQLDVQIDALDRTFQTTIDEIVPQADAPSRTFLVKATLPRSQDLYEGMFGRLLIPAGERRHLCLATDAIVQIGQLQFVDVVLENGTKERRLIKTGKLGMPGRQEVLSGLEAGETVILHEADGTTPNRRPVGDAGEDSIDPEIESFDGETRQNDFSEEDRDRLGSAGNAASQDVEGQ